MHLGFTATTSYRQFEEVIFTVSSCWYFITICVGKTLQQTPPYMGVLSQFHQVVVKHARRTRQEIGSDLPVFHPAQSVPHTYSSRPSAFKRFNLLRHQSFQRTYNDHNAISLALLACQILRGVSSSTRTSRFWLGDKQTHHDRLRRLVPLSVVHKTRLSIQGH